MKVSIIIPLYNAERYVKECLESAINQTYRNVEIIVVDDGSTDGALEIVESVATNDNRVIVISQENKGGSAARNVGIKKATGQYVQFLDADDTLDLDKIRIQMEKMKQLQYPQDMVVFGQWSILGAPLSEMAESHQSVWHDYECPVDLLVDFPIKGCCLPLSAYLVPKELIKMVGGWDETLRLNDDGEFFARIIKEATKLIYTKNSVAYYRSTPNSVSKTLNPIYADSWIRSLIKTSDIIIESQHPQAEEAVCKMISSCLCRLYPYYSTIREKGENYLKAMFPYYVVRYPKLNWKEKIYYKIQSMRDVALK